MCAAGQAVEGRSGQNSERERRKACRRLSWLRPRLRASVALRAWRMMAFGARRPLLRARASCSRPRGDDEYAAGARRNGGGTEQVATCSFGEKRSQSRYFILSTPNNCTVTAQKGLSRSLRDGQPTRALSVAIRTGDEATTTRAQLHEHRWSSREPVQVGQHT